jgi:hypothetical protein
MAHQFVRQSLRAEEADRLANACRSLERGQLSTINHQPSSGVRISSACGREARERRGSGSRRSAPDTMGRP